jgi:predicted PurR-regulated permease PerM
MSIINNITLSLSKKSFLRLILFVIITLLVIYIRYLILTLILSFILASFAKYFATMLQSRYKINYKYGLFAIFIGLLVLIILSISLFLPLLLREGYDLFQSINIFLDQFESWLNWLGIQSSNIDLNQFASLIPNLGQITLGVLGVFGQIITYTLLIFVLAFYISINQSGVNNLIKLFVPDNIKDDVPSIVKKSEYHIGKWAFMEVGLAVIVGILVYGVLYMFNFQYAVLFSLLAGIAQLVPLLGPIIIFLMILTYAFSKSFITGVFVLVSIVFIELIKQFLILPVIFESFRIKNTLLVVISLMIGGVLAGPLGVIIAMPVLSLSNVVYKDIMSYDK